MPIKNKVQLITYPDSLGGDLKSLDHLLRKHFADIFAGGVHILPPFLSSDDRGFAPYDYFTIDPAFGSWEDVRRIGERFDVLVDLMVNHVSRQSVYFKDFERLGRRSQWADLFITLDKIWPSGDPPAEDLRRIFLRRPEHPFADVTIQTTGERERVWATFGTQDWSEQIDIDVQSPVARQLFTDILTYMSRNGVKIVRLDAVGYVIKKPGTSCFFVEPEIYEFIDWILAEAGRLGLELLPEVHGDYELQLKLARRGYWVYNFVLPFLVLHSFMSRSSLALQEHLQTCPHNQFTMLDCHDGIPVQPDLDGLVSIDEAQSVVQACLRRGANLNRILSAGHLKRPDFDAHQINITYYSALGEDDDAYLTARAIQFFAPGVPQVYYVGLLAGENAPEEVERTGEGRAINRRNYSVDEVEQALTTPVVRRLLDLIRLRNTHPAFNGEFEVLPAGPHELRLAWRSGSETCSLFVDFEQGQAAIEATGREAIKLNFHPGSS